MLLFAISLCLVSGCVSHSSGVTEARTVAPESEPIPAEVLADHGLETLWYFPSDTTQNPVMLAQLLPDGLLVATKPGTAREGLLR